MTNFIRRVTAPKQPTERKVVLKTPDEIAIMREAGRIVARAHEAMKAELRAGISTLELDKIAETVIRDHGATPTFLGYAPSNHRPYPGSINASINDELVHGIPSAKRILKDGDIISLDTACLYNGFVGDAAYTYAIGEVKPAIRRLIEATEAALYVAIELSVVGNRISDVAKGTARYASNLGYSVAHEYTGHGVGRKMHEAPQVPNWWPSKIKADQNWQDYDIQAGMTYAIEPMLIAGRSDLYEDVDGWTVKTKDRSLCAHFEHTIAVTDEQPQILTLL